MAHRIRPPGRDFGKADLPQVAVQHFCPGGKIGNPLLEVGRQVVPGVEADLDPARPATVLRDRKCGGIEGMRRVGK